MSEDNRTERFLRYVLKGRGCNWRRLRFETAPAGTGAADAWVCQRYVESMRLLRRKRDQSGLGLLTAIDGDSAGLSARKQQLDQALESGGLDPRLPDERVAVMVPCWSIETWLLQLLGVPDIEEGRSLKKQFEDRRNERTDLRDAAARWGRSDGSTLASLDDAQRELERLFT